jgi:alpha-L-fucosidase
VTTQRGDTVYVHVLDWEDRGLTIPDFGATVRKAYMLSTGESVEVEQSDAGITLVLPVGEASEPDRVIVLETD